MKITWEVEDGYVGKSSPQVVDVPDEELAECETDEEKHDLVEEYVQQDFNNNISYSYDNPFS
jgi:hypothetical protein